jgi:hypothetical protein
MSLDGMNRDSALHSAVDDSTNLSLDPWPHLVLDNFLPEDALAQSLIEIQADSYSYDIEYRGAGRIEFSVLKSPTLWRQIYSKRTVSVLSSAFGVELVLDKHNLVQLRRMNEETPEFPTHNDFAENEDTIASFLYLSSGWSPSCGGRFHLFSSKEEAIPSQSLSPIQNRFLAFRTKPTHWHSVERVHGWERLSILSLWNITNPEHEPLPNPRA